MRMEVRRKRGDFQKGRNCQRLACADETVGVGWAGRKGASSGSWRLWCAGGASALSQRPHSASKPSLCWCCSSSVVGLLLNDPLAVGKHNVIGEHHRCVEAAPAVHQVGRIRIRRLFGGSIDVVVVLAAEVLVGTLVAFHGVIAWSTVEFIVARAT